MKLGDFLFFDPYLIHRSGYNSTKDEIRFSLVITWNDCSYTGWRAPVPIFRDRSLTSKTYFSRLTSKKDKYN